MGSLIKVIFLQPEPWNIPLIRTAPKKELPTVLISKTAPKKERKIVHILKVKQVVAGKRSDKT